MTALKLCVIAGDGIGPELTEKAVLLIREFGNLFDISYAQAGYDAYKKTGSSLPEETIKKCRQSNAILFGAVTTPPHIKGYTSPIVTLRKTLNLYANIRPFFSLPIRHSMKKIDFIIVRENTEDLYGGVERKIHGGFVAERVITKTACMNIIKKAFDLARKRKKKVTVVHKANVLRLTDGLFLNCAHTVAKKYTDIAWNDMLVDSCALQLIKNPQQFDVLVTTNMFGDILSDEAAALVGGLGVAASANIGKENALFEPVHGSAPKYRGLNKVNPLAMLFAVCMLFDHCGMKRQMEKLKKALFTTVQKKIVTYDLGGKYTTEDVIDEVISQLRHI